MKLISVLIVLVQLIPVKTHYEESRLHWRKSMLSPKVPLTLQWVSERTDDVHARRLENALLLLLCKQAHDKRGTYFRGWAYFWEITVGDSWKDGVDVEHLSNIQYQSTARRIRLKKWSSMTAPQCSSYAFRLPLSFLMVSCTFLVFFFLSIYIFLILEHKLLHCGRTKTDHPISKLYSTCILACTVLNSMWSLLPITYGD